MDEQRGLLDPAVPARPPPFLTRHFLLLDADSDDSPVEIRAHRDTATGEVVRQRPVSLSAVASGTPPTLSAQEGLAAAMQAVPGGEVLEFDLETEEGAVAWYALVRDTSGPMEVYVNADTGAIISQVRDS